MNSKRISILIITVVLSIFTLKGAYAAAPVGTHDGLGTVSACSTKGWAYDPDTSSASISVDIYKDGGAGSGTALGRFSANVSRSDVDTAKGITGNHGFDVDLTSYLSDGKSHSLYVYAIDSSGAGTNPLLSNSPKTITCPAPTGPGSGGSTSAPVSLNVTGTTIITKNVGQAYAVYWGSANVTSCTVTENGAQISSNCSPLGSPAAYNSYSVPKGKPASGIYLYVITATGSNGVTISSPAAEVIVSLANNNNNTTTTTATTSDNLGVTTPTTIGAPTIDVFKAVNGNPTTCNISAAPNPVVLPGNATTLTWSCNNFINACILYSDNPKISDIFTVTSNGSKQISAIATTTMFTLKCPGASPASVSVGVFKSKIIEVNP